jgi:hypothetical protein
MRVEMTTYNNATLQIAYDMGYQAYDDQIQADENPFNPKVAPDLYKAWANGWSDSRDDS